ncbi:MAG: hypothetical protein VB858_18950, partial [Planctomycetaceae bacterium]
MPHLNCRRGPGLPRENPLSQDETFAAISEFLRLTGRCLLPSKYFFGRASQVAFQFDVQSYQFGHR